jgi:hypothetical protein
MDQVTNGVAVRMAALLLLVARGREASPADTSETDAAAEARRQQGVGR